MSSNLFKVVKYCTPVIILLIITIAFFIIAPHDNLDAFAACVVAFVLIICPSVLIFICIFGNILVFNVIDKFRHNTDIDVVKTFGQLKVGDKIWCVSKKDYKDNELAYIAAIEEKSQSKIRFKLLTNNLLDEHLTCNQYEFSSLVSESSSDIFFSNKVIYDKYIEIERKKALKNIEIERIKEKEVYNNIDVEKGIDEAFSFLKKRALKK